MSVRRSLRCFGEAGCRTLGFLIPAEIRVDSCSFVVSLSVMREFLEFVIRQLIEFPDDMVLTEIPSGRTTVFKLQLRQSDVGRVIGRSGQTIHAIRALLASSAARHGQRATIEIVE